MKTSISNINGAREVKIRAAAQKDLDVFWDIFSKSIETQFTGYSPKLRNYFLRKLYSKENFKQWLIEKEVILLLALQDGKIIGYLLATLPFSGTSYLIWMTVEEPFRKKGIGGALLNQYEILIKRKGAQKIHIWASDTNFDFYKENGYKPLLRDSFKIQEWLFCKKL